MQAGLVAVPLSVPQFGAHDERVASVLEDSAPSVVLTTSAVVADVNKYARPHGGRPAPAVIEVDLIDVDVTRDLDDTDHSHPGPAYLRYLRIDPVPGGCGGFASERDRQHRTGRSGLLR